MLPIVSCRTLKHLFLSCTIPSIDASFFIMGLTMDVQVVIKILVDRSNQQMILEAMYSPFTLSATFR